MSTELNESTKKVIQQELGLAKFTDVLDREYQDITLEEDVDRDKCKKYSGRNRGSVRLNRGLFYTIREFKDWTNKVKHIKLP